MAKSIKRGKKLANEILSIRGDTAGNEVVGYLGEIQKLFKQDNTPVVGSFGQELETVELIDIDTAEVNRYWLDGGLRGQLKVSKCLPGKPYFIKHTGEGTFEMENGQTAKIQKYEITEALVD